MKYLIFANTIIQEIILEILIRSTSSSHIKFASLIESTESWQILSPNFNVTLLKWGANPQPFNSRAPKLAISNLLN